MNTDILIIGAGPAGIFTAMELLRQGSRQKILLVEKGKAVEERRCPKGQTGRCMNCKPYCHITTGFSGAGAFSDGKLSLSTEVGGDLPQLIGDDLAQSLLAYTDSIYLEFGADSHVEGVSEKEAVKEIRKRAIQTGLKLVDCPIPSPGHGESPGNLHGHRALSAGKRGGNSFWLRLYRPDSAGWRMFGRLFDRRANGIFRICQAHHCGRRTAWRRLV